MKSFDTLWMRFTIAFSLLILIVVGAMTWAGTRLADAQFRRYVTNNSLRLAGSMAERLLTYYQRNGSWIGIADAIAELEAGAPPGDVSVWFGFRPPADPNAVRRVEVILANARGRVVYHNTHALENKRLDSRELDSSYAIYDPESERVVGYLLLSLPARDLLGPMERQFITRFQRLVGISGIVAVLVAMVAGVLFSLNLTAPLRRVAEAAKAVAAGDFTKRVPVQGGAEIAQVAANFNEMTEALQEAERLRQNMVADVAHELRTPLSVVQGSLRAILDDVYPLSKEEIAHLYDETRLLSRLTEDLRELAQADAGQLRLHPVSVEVSDWLTRAALKFGPAAEMKGISLEIDVPDDLGTIQADPDRLSQVLANLVSNALRHTPEGGRIQVSARKRLDLDAPAVEISIADNGEGISSDELARIFERFHRVDRSRSREHGGSGLGLSIAQSLVQMHGGAIWAESELGHGATFIFQIPLAIDPEG